MKSDRDEDWFPWDQESEESPPASATTGPWPGLGAAPWRAPAVESPSSDGVPAPAAVSIDEEAKVDEDVKATDEIEFRSYGAPSPAGDARSEEPLTAAAQNAKDTDELEVPAPEPADDGEPVTGDEATEAPVDGDAGAGEGAEVPETGGTAWVEETVTDIPAALVGVPGPWDAAVAPAAKIRTRVDEPLVPSPRDAEPSSGAAEASPWTDESRVSSPGAAEPSHPSADLRVPSPGGTESSPGAGTAVPIPEPVRQAAATSTAPDAGPPSAATVLDRPGGTDMPPAAVGGPEAAASPASAAPTVSDLPAAGLLTAAGHTPPEKHPTPPGHTPPEGHPAPPGQTMALEVPGAPVPPQPFPPPYPPGPGHQPPILPPPAAGGRSGGPSPRMTAALAAAGLAVLVAAAIAVVFSQAGGSSNAPCSGAACATTKQATSAAAAPAGPKLRYRTVDRETGYFEGTITIVNRGGRPMSAWTLTFTYPGADIHNAWEAVLMRRGETVTIANAATAAPIAPGGRFEVQFGGAGRPAMPTGCRLNDAPCVFVR